MIRINPTTQINYSFSALSKNNAEISQDDKKKDKTKKLVLAVAGLAVTGAAAILIGKKSKMTYEEALKKNGIEIKDNIAVLIKNGEKYTGSVKRNVHAYGTRKETVTFVDGVMTEKVYHSFKGKELEGEFYKDGVKRIAVSRTAKVDSKNVWYTRYDFDDKGKLCARSTCNDLCNDKFESARDAIKKL